jgi:hypothetical protein
MGNQAKHLNAAGGKYENQTSVNSAQNLAQYTKFLSQVSW